MPITNQRLIGINSVGSFTGADPGPFTDTAWGNTQQDGVQVQFNTETAELQSGQATMLESVNLVRASMGLLFAMVVAELQVFQRLLGMPVGAHVGDLSLPTPTAEKLTFTTSNLGSREDLLFIVGPGPASTRTVRAFRVRVSDLGEMAFASNTFQTPGATWEVLVPQGATPDPPLTIEDAV